MANNTATVASVDEDCIKIALGSELAGIIFHQLLRYNAQVIFKNMETILTDIYESPTQCARWEDLQSDMKRVEAINVLLEYYGHRPIDLPFEMERLSK